MQNRFKEVTRLFYQGQYQQGFTKIHQLTKQQPQNTILYVNKALFLSQIGKQQQAIECLQRSLLMNPLNYVAYFNLFSIQTRNNQDQQAFSNLCCAISVMFLIRGRTLRDIQDLHQSIYYSGNNLQAYALCALLEMENKQYERAKKLLQNTLLQITKCQILKKIFIEICRKIDPQYTESNQSEQLQRVKFGQKRLKNSIITTPQTDFIKVIGEKLKLFNQLYNQINTNYGGITQKVPKQSSFFNNIETFMLQKSKVKSNQSDIAVLQNEEYFISASQISELKQAQKKQQILGQAAQSLVTAYHSSRNKDISVIEEVEQDRLSMQSQPSHIPQNSKFELYPCNIYTKFQLNVIKLSLFNYQKLKPLQGIYCILSYGNTRSKMITSPIRCIQGDCLWNKVFEDVELQKQPSVLKLKVYNKKKNQIRDQFIGEFQVQLVTCDLLKLPIFNKEGEQVGNILTHVQIQRNIQ